MNEIDEKTRQESDEQLRVAELVTERDDLKERNARLEQCNARQAEMINRLQADLALSKIALRDLQTKIDAMGHRLETYLDRYRARSIGDTDETTQCHRDHLHE